MKHSISGFARVALAAALLGVAAGRAGRNRDPVVARDDRRATTTASTRSPSNSTTARATTRSPRSTRAAIRRRWPPRSPRTAPATRRTSCRCSRSAPATMMAAKGAIKPVYEVMARGRARSSTRRPTCPPSPATTRTPRDRCCRSRSTARRRCSGTTRTRSRRRGSIPTRRRRRGRRSSPRWPS